MIPIPYGYNVFYVAGQTAAELGNGADPVQESGHFFKTAIESFMPISISESESSFNQLVKIMAGPLIGEVEIGLNENRYGSKIRSESSEFAKVKKPVSHSKRSATPEWMLSLTSSLNELTGGNPAVSKGVDISPDNLAHRLKFITGAAGATLFRISGYLSDLANGEETSINQVPIVRRFKGEVTPWAKIDKFNDYRAQVYAAAAELEYYEENSVGPIGAKMSPLDLALADLEGDAKDADKEIRRLFKERRELMNDGGSQEDIDAQMQSITEEQNAFLKLYNETVKSL